MASTGSALQQKLASTRRWWRTTRVLRGAAWAICTLGVLALVCYRIDSHFVLAPTSRIAWRLVILLSSLCVLAVCTILSLAKKLPDSVLATEVERCYPTLQERLLTTIELTPTLALSGDAAGFSRQMTLSLAEQTSRETSGMNFLRAVNTRSLRNASVTSLVVVGLLLAQRFAAPESFDNWLSRMRNPNADIPVWANTRVWVTPDHDLLPVGAGVNVAITTRGAQATTCTLYYRPAGDKNATWRSISLNGPHQIAQQAAPVGSAAEPTADATQFSCRLPSLANSVEMYARANDGRSNDKMVVVEPRPTLLNVKLTMHFPAYMHRESQVIPVSTGNIAAPVGTTVDVEASANKPLKSALLSKDMKEVGPLTIAANGLTTKTALSVFKDGSYSVALTDRHDFGNALPSPLYEIHAIPDMPPTVQVLRPATDIDLVPDGSIPLVANATDDYGVTQVKLLFVRQRADAMARTGAASMRTVSGGTLPLPLAATAPQVSISERWHLSSVHGNVGDTVRYEVDAVDNDTLNGPHVGRSNVLNVHLVSVLEMQRKLKDSLDEEARALTQLRQSQIDAQKQLKQARLKMDPAALTQAQEAQRAVADEAKAITQRIADISAELENNNLATKSELARREAAEQTLQAVAQQKAPSAADAVQNAAQSKSQATRSQDVQHADSQETEVRHDIEKAQDLLQRTASPEQLAAEAKRLATEQERLADTARSISEGIKEQKQQTGSNTLSPELKIGVETERQQQQQANEDTQRLQKQLNQAATAAQERGQQKQADALRQAANALEKANVQSQQAMAEQNLNQNRPEKAAPQQDRAAAGLEKAAQAAQQAASQDPNAANTADQLEKAAQQLHDLAKQQQAVADKTAQNPGAQQSQDLANQERNIQNQANLAQQNLNGSQRAQQSLNNAQQNLSQAGKNLSQNQAQQAHQPANRAAQNLEDAAKQAENAAQQLRQQQAASELADKVERLAQVQAGLKTQTQRLQATREQRQLTNNEKGELGQIGARQLNVEEEARALADQFPSPSFQKALQKAAEQAHPATQNLNPDNGLQPDTGQRTQAAQAKAAQTLNAVAQALKQQAQASKDQQPQQDQDQQQQQQNAEQQEEAAALGELLLAQGLQQQVRQNTGQLDQDRHNQPLNSTQQEQARDAARDQQDTQDITNHAAEALSQIPGIADALHNATQHMEQSHSGLNQQQTGQPVQAHQDAALQNLAQAQQKAQEAMQQQQQQQQAQQAARQGAPQPTRQPGANPDRNAFTRLEGPGANGNRQSPTPGSGNFASLSERAQRTMREGKQEKVPAEYQDLVSRYYKSLSEKK